MGGDGAPAATIAGAVRASRAGVPVLLVGDEAALRARLPRGVSLPILHAPDAVGMGEHPVSAVRRKPGASVNVAARAVAEGQARAWVSCGNTGAAMAAALFHGRGRMPGVDRAAVTTVLPRGDGGRLVLLDLGANVDCRPQHLAQFARMGAVFARVALGLADPRVGLLSNGDEPTKGNDLVRAALPLIAAQPLTFVGQIEPPAAFRGGCDVLVCDGFVGNVLLKTAEATAEVVGRLLKEEILRFPTDRLAAWMLRGALQRFRKRTDYAEEGGALLLGVQDVVVIGHGRSDAGAVAAALRRAERFAAQGLTDRLAEAMAAPARGGG